jgi:hypothetical protein
VKVAGNKPAGKGKNTVKGQSKSNSTAGKKTNAPKVAAVKP